MHLFRIVSVAGQEGMYGRFCSPVPRVTWRRVDGAPLPTARLVGVGEVDFGKSLVIDPIRPSDAGVYECSAMNIRHQMDVNVVGKCILTP
jgi:hypothetical protein